MVAAGLQRLQQDRPVLLTAIAITPPGLLQHQVVARPLITPRQSLLIHAQQHHHPVGNRAHRLESTQAHRTTDMAIATLLLCFGFFKQPHHGCPIQQEATGFGVAQWGEQFVDLGGLPALVIAAAELLDGTAELLVPALGGLRPAQGLELFKQPAAGFMQRQHIAGTGKGLVASRQSSPFASCGLLLWEGIAELQPEQQAIEPPAPAVGVIGWIAPALAVFAITAPADARLIEQLAPLGLRQAAQFEMFGQLRQQQHIENVVSAQTATGQRQ